MINFSEKRAFIFDNDGVIVNSEPLSCAALHDLLLEQYNIEIGTDFSAVIGTSDQYAIDYYLEDHGITDSPNYSQLSQRKMEIYFDTAAGRLQPFAGFHRLLTYLQKHYQLAVASSGNHDKIKFSLEEVDASKYFPIICSATEVEHGKPHPDLFEFTAECLAIPEQDCVVIEDSTKGIQGAKRAGMAAIGFTSSFSAEMLLNAGADLTVESLDELYTIIKNQRGGMN